MKSLLFPLSFCLAVATAAVPSAQEVRDGSHWTGGGVTIGIDVGIMGDGVAIQAISASGWSNIASGTQGDHCTGEHASCEDSGVMNVPVEGGSMQVRAKDGRMERKKDGTWIPMRRNWRTKELPNRGSHTDFGGGEEVTSLPTFVGVPVVWGDYR